MAEGRADDLTEDQRFLLVVHYSAIMRIQQNRFLLGQLGVIGEDILLQLGGRGGLYRRAFFAEFWAERKGNYPDDFQEFVERQGVLHVQLHPLGPTSRRVVGIRDDVVGHHQARHMQGAGAADLILSDSRVDPVCRLG